MSKHKTPKNEKHKVRKDLKDYTGEGTNDCQWEATGEVLPGDRKDDKFPNKDGKIYKHVANHDPKDHNPKMVVDLKDSDRIYPIKDMQDGNPKMQKHSKEAFEKNVQKDAEEYIETMSKKDGGYTSQIKKLTKEQKEKLVREVVKRKVLQFLSEQENKEEEKPEAETPDPAAATDATGEPADTAAATTTEPVAPETPEEPETPEVAPEPETPEEPEPDAEPEKSEDDPDGDGQPGDARISKFIQALEQKPNIVQQMKTIMSVINKITADDDKKRKVGKLMLLKRAIDRAVAQLN
jgi:hypothetical protein